jgi:hypothetical protein
MMSGLLITYICVGSNRCCEVTKRNIINNMDGLIKNELFGLVKCFRNEYE